MIRLMLLRHAKSSWAEAGMADADRPLAPRGRRAAAAMAGWMAAGGCLPDRILCSPARRTRETLDALLPLLPDPGIVEIVPELYESPSSDYRGPIAAAGGRAARLLVIGHNPTLQATALLFAGAGDPGIRGRMAAKFPAGALAVVAFDRAEWAAVRPHGGTLEAFLRPRDLSGDGGDDD